MNLDALSSDESAGPGDVSAAPICISDASSSPVNPQQVLSDDDLLTAVRAEDRRQVIRICDVPPDVQVVDLSQEDQISDTRLAVWGAEPPPDVPGGDSQQTVCVVNLPPEARISDIPPRVGAVDLTPVIRAVDVPAVGRMETVQPTTSPDSPQMSPDSPPTVAFEDLSVSSVPMSPNRVRVENFLDVPEEGPMFEVSPDTSGFLMRPSGAAVQTPGACFPFLQVLGTFSDPVLGDPVTFALSAPVPGSDAPPMTLPVYTMPSGLTFLQDSLRFRQLWRQQYRVSRRGGPPVCHGLLMFLGRAHLTHIGIAPWSRRACRAVRIELRLTLGRQSQIQNRRLACSFITPGFWSLSGRQIRLGCCIIPRRFGCNIWERRMFWRLR